MSLGRGVLKAWVRRIKTADILVFKFAVLQIQFAIDNQEKRCSYSIELLSDNYYRPDALIGIRQNLLTLCLSLYGSTAFRGKLLKPNLLASIELADLPSH